MGIGYNAGKRTRRSSPTTTTTTTSFLWTWHRLVNAAEGMRSCRGAQMQHPGFFHRAGPFSLKDIAAATGAVVIGEDTRTIDDVRPLLSAGERDISFFENRKYADLLGTTRAAACILAV